MSQEAGPCFDPKRAAFCGSTAQVPVILDVFKIRLLKLLDCWLGAALVRLLTKPPASPPHHKEPHSLLLIRPGGIGDAIHLVPAIQMLQKSFPNIAIDVLAEQRNAGAFALCPGIHDVFVYDRPGQLLQVLRNRYDVVIDTEQWHCLSAVVARLVRAPVKIGFATNKRARLFTHAIRYSHEDYEAASFLKLLEPLAIATIDPPSTEWLCVSDDSRERAAELCRNIGGRPFVVLFPGASIAEKRWGTDRFRAVAKWCLYAGLGVVVVGGAEEQSSAEQVAAGLNVVNLAGQTSLGVTAAIIEKALVTVSGDSGILHIAAGLNRPTVALFGPGSVTKWAPRGPRHVVLSKGLPCSPCTRFGYTPPCPHQMRCMREITVDEVTNAIDAVIREAYSR